jgi:serine/threonine protein kinase
MDGFIPHNIGHYVFVTPIKDLLWLGNDSLAHSNVLIRLVQRSPSAPMPPELVSGIAALKRLLHPPFAQLRDVLQDGSFVYIVSDAPGPRSLRAFVEEHGPIPEAAAKLFLCQFIDAARRYAEASSSSFVVTDDQIFVDETGRILQVFVSQQLPADSLPFSAPELLSGHEAPGSVIWCAAVFIYFLTLGRLPFRGTDAADLRHQILRSQPEIPRTISPELIVLLIKMFAKNPMARVGIEKLGKDRWMDSLPEEGRAVFVERRRSLNRLQVPDGEAAPEDGDAGKVAAHEVRLMPKRVISVRPASRAPSPLTVKSRFPNFVIGDPR